MIRIIHETIYWQVIRQVRYNIMQEYISKFGLYFTKCSIGVAVEWVTRMGLLIVGVIEDYRQVFKSSDVLLLISIFMKSNFWSVPMIADLFPVSLNISDS